MDSNPVEGAGPAGSVSLDRGLLHDPYLWTLLAALALGLALALLLLSLRARREGGERRAARLSAWALALLSLGLLALAALLIFPPKASLGSSLLVASGLAALAAGFAAGLFPRAFGLPLLALLLAAAAFLLSALEAWVPLAGPGELARLVPFSVEAGSCRGELELAAAQDGERVLKLELDFVEAGLAVERLELDGPLGLLAGGPYYRVVGLRGPRGELVSLGKPAAQGGLFERLLPLEGGAEAEASFPFMRRRRESSLALPLQAFAPIVFSFRREASGALGLRAEGASFIERARP